MIPSSSLTGAEELHLRRVNLKGSPDRRFGTLCGAVVHRSSSAFDSPSALGPARPRQATAVKRRAPGPREGNERVNTRLDKAESMRLLSATTQYRVTCAQQNVAFCVILSLFQTHSHYASDQDDWGR